MTVAESVACEKLQRMLKRRESSASSRPLPDISCFGVCDVSSRRVLSVFENYYAAQRFALSLLSPAMVVTLRAFSNNNTQTR